GTGTQSPINTTYGATVTLPACSFARSGYSFSGWKINGTVYKAGDKVKNLCTGGQVVATAQWKGNPYTITFAANGGTGTQASISTTYGTTVTLPACSYTRTGYTFAGWKIGSKVYKAGDKVKDLATSGKITATAQWTPITYTIVFAANGGTGSMSKLTVKYDETKALPKCSFSKAGSTFANWKWNDKTYANGASVKNLTSTNGATLTFTAQWKANSYTIVFEENGGTGTQANISTTYGATVTLPACSFARTGYTFAGWKINDTVYKAGDKVKNLCTGGQVVATAQWTPITYTIAFAANGGTGTMSNITVKYNETKTLPKCSFSKAGSSFTAWKWNDKTYANGASVKNLTSTNGATITFTAQWKANSYTIVFEDNGGTGTQASISTTYGATVTLPACSFARTGYTFAGWKINGTVYKAGDKVKNLCTGGQVVATAQWTPITYTIAFAANGGTGTMSSITLKYDETKALPKCAFSYTGSSFTGWKWNGKTYANGASVKNLTSTNGATLTFTAQWKANSYTIVFEENGGTGTQANISTTYGATVTLPVCSFARTGYSFAGWKINGTVYKAGDKVKNLCTGGQVVATAQWKGNPYTIVFAANGGTGKQSSVNTTYGETVTLPACSFTRTGCSFAGWKIGSKVYKAGEKVKNLCTDEQVVAIAQWKGNPYTIVFEENGGTGTQANISTMYSATVTLPACSFTRTGYSFAGWKINGTVYKAGDRVKNLCTGGQVVATAQWKGNTYTVQFDPSGGVGNMDDQVMVYGTSKKLSLNTFTKTGYTFAGWTRTKGSTTIDLKDEQAVATLAPRQGQVVTLYAVWHRNPTYSLIFNPMGGTGYMEQEYFVWGVPQKIQKNQFKYFGKVFVGWSKTRNGTKADYVDEQVVSSVIKQEGAVVELFAVWKDSTTYTLRFNSNGGTGTMADQPMTYDVSESIRVNTFKKKGYYFAGWSLTKDPLVKKYSDGQFVSRVTATDKAIVTLYAIWEVAPVYKVRFDSNGGSGLMSIQQHVYGESTALTQNAFKRTGYTFMGWSTDKKATTATYRDEQPVKNLSSTNGETIVLYAIWSQNKYSIVYYPNNGTPTLKTVAMKGGKEVVIEANTFEKSNSEFVLWNTKSDGTGTCYTAGQILKKGFDAQNNETIRLFAQWRSDRITSTDSGKTFKYEAWVLPKTYVYIPFVKPATVPASSTGLYKSEYSNPDFTIMVNGYDITAPFADGELDGYIHLLPDGSAPNAQVSSNDLYIYNNADEPKYVKLSFVSDQYSYTLDGHTSMVWKVNPYALSSFPAPDNCSIWEVYLCPDDISMILTMDEMQKKLKEVEQYINISKDTFWKNAIGIGKASLETAMTVVSKLDIPYVSNIVKFIGYLRKGKSIFDIFADLNNKPAVGKSAESQRTMVDWLSKSVENIKRVEYIDEPALDVSEYMKPGTDPSNYKDLKYKLVRVDYGIHFTILVHNSDPTKDTLFNIPGGDLKQWDCTNVSMRYGAKGEAVTGSEAAFEAASRLQKVNVTPWDSTSISQKGELKFSLQP
ncbi:MAG: InlB B-repeat-containing protein, partial [Lachnospiraceae bacterium]|nr:InlB B-repeat-containing protein [Lachnospiraceae bacterium]